MTSSSPSVPPPDPPTTSDAPPSGPASWSARPVLRISRRHVAIAAAVLAGLAAIGILLVAVLLPRVLTRPLGGQPEAATAAPADTRRIQATMFFVSPDGRELMPVSRQVTYGASTLDQVRYIVEAVLEPPPDGARSAIPAGTTLRSVFLSADGRAFVDLGGTIVSGHPGGSLNEALTVYAIVNAVTINIPAVSSVQILVNGQQVDTLAGHIDLRYPLAKAQEWVRKEP
jgi:hypothetical protein